MNCQKEMADDTLFCGVCGFKVEKQVEVDKVSSKWAWVLSLMWIISFFLNIQRPTALIELLHQIILVHDGFWVKIYIGYLVHMVVMIIITIVFLFLDKKQISKFGYEFNWVNWILGIIILPAYLFMRAKETNTKYHYAIISLIVWCLPSLRHWF